MSGSDTVLRRAAPADLGAVMDALRALAGDLDDPFTADENRVRGALFGPGAFAFAILALRGAAACGIALCNPVLSTTHGGTVAHVSDLWVDRATRGQALGRRLLQAAMTEARICWQAVCLRLPVYGDNNGALAFYRHLGFAIHDRDKMAVLDAGGLDRLMEVRA